MIKQALLSFILCIAFSHAFSQDLSITNSLPASASPGQDFEAKYTLTKSPTMGAFAKFQVDLPAGYNAQSIDLKGGNFTFENNRVKIVWVSLPGDASFDFSFKITPASNASGNVSIAPQFYYLENNVKKEYNVPAASVDLGGGGAVATNSDNGSNNNTMDNSNSSNNTATDNSNANTNTDNSNNQGNNTTSDNSANNGNNNTATNTNTEPVNNNNASNNNNVVANNTKTTTSSNSGNTTTAKSGVVYHVQLAALTNKPNKARFAEYGAVKVVEDAGLFKVLVGKFSTLEEARAYKKNLIAKGAEGVFVVAYENGVRVKIN